MRPTRAHRRAEQLNRRLRQLGPPFAASHLMAALRAAAGRITRLRLEERHVALLVLNALTGEQFVRSHNPVSSPREISQLFVWRIPQQIYVNGAQAIALAFVAGDLHIPSQGDRCYALSISEWADDLLLEWCGSEIDTYCYVLVADSTGRTLLARAPTIGRPTGTFRVESDREVLESLLPITITEALRMRAICCWPSK